MTTVPYVDRRDAGQKLTLLLKAFEGDSDVLVLALPRGGVVVGYEIARELHLLFDIVVARKIGFPGNSEFAIGAITEDGEGVFDSAVIRAYRISSDYLEEEKEKEQREIFRRLQLYRGDRSPLVITGKKVILVDDGIATGATIRAAIQWVKRKAARSLVVAVPVASRESLEMIETDVDRVICPYVPEDFQAVGNFYEHFSQVSDEEVVEFFRNSLGSAGTRTQNQ